MCASRVRPFTVLLADDGSEHAQAAAALLGDLLGRSAPPAAVTVMGVITPLEASGHAAREDSLERTQAALRRRGVEAQTELVLGYPAEKLVEWAGAHQPDLIVMGAKGRRATLSILLGGVAQQVVEYGSWPTLVVRSPYRGLQRVVLVTDGSASGQRAAEYLCGGACQPCLPLPAEIDLRVLHVLPPQPSAEALASAWPAVTSDVFTGAQAPDYHTLVVDLEDLAQEQQADGQELLDRTLQAFAEVRLQARPVLRRGDAATEILRYINEEGIDLVVSGSRGLSPVSGWLLGSVSRKLLHYAPCAVLVVRGQ